MAREVADHVAARTRGGDDPPSRGRRRISWLSVYIGALVVFLLVPIVITIPVSFNETSSLSFPPTGFTFDWYTELFADSAFRAALWTSVQVTTISTVLTLVIGSLSCYALARFRFPGRAVLHGLLMGPLIFPHIVLGLAMIVFLNAIGLVRTVTGLVIATVVITLPYITRTLTPAVEALDPSIDEVAMVMGASRWRTLWSVVLPNVRTALFASAVLTGIVAFDEFTVALFITGGDTVTLPVQLYVSSYFGISPSVAALGTLLVLLSAVVVLVLERTIGVATVFGVGRLAATPRQPGAPKPTNPSSGGSHSGGST